MKSYFHHYGYTLNEQAKELRKNPTDPERKIWFCCLKEIKPRFHFQRIVGPYIFDFYCPQLKLGIELDGESHAERAAYDAERTAFLSSQGIEILRYTNEDIMLRFDAVKEHLYQIIQKKGGRREQTALSNNNPPVGFAGHPPAGGQEKELLMKTVTIYTDGACSGNPGPGGWGAILCCGGVEKELSGGEASTTNNRMELTAVISALRALKYPCIVELYSDSKYVIDALQKGWVWGWKKKGWIKSDKKPALNVDLWEELLPLVKTHEVHYHWVKGHAENEKNNRCDQLAVAESKKF